MSPVQAGGQIKWHNKNVPHRLALVKSSKRLQCNHAWIVCVACTVYWGYTTVGYTYVHRCNTTTVKYNFYYTLQAAALTLCQAKINDCGWWYSGWRNGSRGCTAKNFCLVGSSFVCNPFPHFLLTLLHSSIQMNSPRLYPTWIKLLSEAKRTDKSPPLHVTHFNYSCPGLLLPLTRCTKARQKKTGWTHRQELFIDLKKKIKKKQNPNTHMPTETFAPDMLYPWLESRLTFYISKDLLWNKVMV